MDPVHGAPMVIDVETELLAAYPALARRLTVVLRDNGDAEDAARTSIANRNVGGHRCS